MLHHNHRSTSSHRYLQDRVCLSRLCRPWRVRRELAYSSAKLAVHFVLTTLLYILTGMSLLLLADLPLMWAAHTDGMILLRRV